PGLASAALGGVDTDRYCAGETLDTPVAERKVLLLLHGGAYCLHSPNLYRLLLAELCARLGAEGYAPNYRLAPEHPHPAGIDDCQAYTRICWRPATARNTLPWWATPRGVASPCR